MMHFFRRSEIHLDCFTSRRDVIEYAPVVNGIEKIPTWWKKLPKSYVEKGSFFPTATMKGCVGLTNYYSKSIAMPLWSELAINVLDKNNYQWQFADEISTATTHDANQFSGFNTSGYGHVKLNTPWFFETKHDIEWMLSCPIYSQDNHNEFIFPQGLLNFKRQQTVNVQLFLNLNQPRSFVIPFNTVFLLTPLSDSKVVIHRHLLTEEQFKIKGQTGVRSTFTNKYQVHNKVKKCPYKDNVK
jgi:hypothetical protein